MMDYRIYAPDQDGKTWSLERLQNGMWVKLKEVPFLA